MLRSPRFRSSLFHASRGREFFELVALACSLVACGDNAPPGGPPQTTSGSGGATAGHAGVTATAGTTGAGASSGSGGAPNGSAGGPTSAAGSPTTGAGGAPSVSGSGGAAAGAPAYGGAGAGLGGAPSFGGAAGSIVISGAGLSGGGASGAAGGPTHVRDHCVDGYDPDPSDSQSTMKDGPADYVESNQTDTIVQPSVLSWMQAHVWESAHFEWHSIRRCTAGTSQSKINVCSHTELIPANQECASDGDGLEFLAMHRHMIQSLKQLWPNHQEQFTGFAKFPQSANDVPPEWRDAWSSFSSQELANAKIADEIDKPENLAKFASEGAFGRWLQCQAPTYSGLHGALHFKWVRTQNTTHGLGNQLTNIDNYMFWKLHGWIDNVWEKYRVAKGLSPDDQALKDQIASQCYQMDKLASLIDPNQATDPGNTTLPSESGVFHTKVRPMFENMTTKCSGCHGVEGPEAGMTLGGHISSADIYANLVNVQSTVGGQFLRVKPGDPEHSWLYLKASGMAASAGCMATSTVKCTTDAMPPTGSATPTTAELQALYDWIKSGAPAPTSP